MLGSQYQQVIALLIITSCKEPDFISLHIIHIVAEALKAPDYTIFFEDEASVMTTSTLGSPETGFYTSGDGTFDMASPIPGRTMAMTMATDRFLRVRKLNIRTTILFLIAWRNSQSTKYFFSTSCPGTLSFQR